MATIAAVVSDLLARPRPVMFLDTCDLLDIIQCLQDVKDFDIDRIKPAVLLTETLVQHPARLQLIVSFLVRIEWTQNLTKVTRDAQEPLSRLDGQLETIHQSWAVLKSPLSFPAHGYSGDGLVDRLITLSRILLNFATELDEDVVCTRRALERVLTKTRPSQGGMIKDSIHLEHGLELVRQLRAGGFSEECVFVSRNKVDYWMTRDRAQLHPDLIPEFDAVNLKFFGTLVAGCGFLRIP